MPALEVRGVELEWSERGEGPPVLLVHETAVDRRGLGRGVAGARGPRRAGHLL